MFFLPFLVTAPVKRKMKKKIIKRRAIKELAQLIEQQKLRTLFSSYYFFLFK